MDEGNGQSVLAVAAGAFRSALVIGCGLSLVLAVIAIGEGQRLTAATTFQSLIVVAPRPRPTLPLQVVPPPGPEQMRGGTHPLYIYPPRSHRFDRSGDAPTRQPDVWPVVVHRVDPEYNEVARRARVSGIVIVEVLIGADGRVEAGRILKPLPFGLDQKAIEAVRQWRFRPGSVDGKPVPVIMNLTLNFRLPAEKR